MLDTSFCLSETVFPGLMDVMVIFQESPGHTGTFPRGGITGQQIRKGSETTDHPTPTEEERGWHRPTGRALFYIRGASKHLASADKPQNACGDGAAEQVQFSVPSMS